MYFWGLIFNQTRLQHVMDTLAIVCKDGWWMVLFSGLLLLFALKRFATAKTAR